MNTPFLYSKVWQTLIEERKYTLGFFFELVLQDYVGKNRHFSMRRLALKSGLSPSMMTQVVKGQRHISDEQMKKVFQNLEIPEHEQRLFYWLLKCSKSSDPEEHEMFALKLVETYTKQKPDPIKESG